MPPNGSQDPEPDCTLAGKRPNASLLLFFPVGTSIPTKGGDAKVSALKVILVDGVSAKKLDVSKTIGMARDTRAASGQL